MHEIAEARNYVLIHRPRIRREEGNDRLTGRNGLRPVRRYGESYGFLAPSTCRFHMGRGAEKLGQEKRVPGAPRIEFSSVDEQAMAHRNSRQSPESNYSPGIIVVNARPGS